MIFVTVGTNKFSFNRLIKKVDELIRDGKITEKVVMQIGYSTYEPRYASWFRFESYEKIKELTKKARLVITHAGVGSILTSLSFNKITIVVPRMKKFNEHIDDHQVELARELSKESKVLVVFDVEQLYKFLNKRVNFVNKNRKNKLVFEIKKYIDKTSKLY
ncbi:MAG: beta-1,4-galactosyltransferase [Candidatus Aenigmarchaeota archaeon]|nr:beta-1,4-galactosyltransferase [Candidatus Aenigmarchaeota archaeon]